VLPLSFAQQRLWFLAQFEGASSAYHIAGGIKLSGDLNREALIRALDRIVARHEALRTCFALLEGEPVQRIAPEDIGFALEEQDLRGDADGEAALQRLAAVEATSPFDLERGPLIRGRLLRVAEAEHVLLVTMHHIVSDGWSIGVLTGELSALYEAFARGAGDPLPPLPVQYVDYAACQRSWLEGGTGEQQARYWKEALAGAPVLLELPTDHARLAQQDYAGATAGVRLDAELTRRLKELSRRHGVTLYMTLLAGCAAVLSRLSGQQDVVIGSPRQSNCIALTPPGHASLRSTPRPFSTRSGLAGKSWMSPPLRLSASATAQTTAPSAPMIEPSPQPLKPPSAADGVLA